MTVKLTDKREFKAKVQGADAYTDVALIKIEAAGFDHGVLVHRTEGAAARAEIRPDDIILRLNDITVKSVLQRESMLAQSSLQ